MSLGCDPMSQYEASQQGMGWSEIDRMYHNYSFGIMLKWLCLDFILYTALGIYMDQVLPVGEGTPRK